MGRKKQLSDADLLEFARAAFIRDGLAAPTREIARAAGVSEAVLFQRYRTKAELFFAAMVPPPPVALDHLFQAPSANFETHLKQVFVALIDYFRDAQPIMAQLSIHPDFKFDNFASKHPDSSMIGMFQQLMRFLAPRLDPTQDISGATLLLISSAYSIASFEAMGAHGGRFQDPMLDVIFDSLWNGLKPATRTRPDAEPKPRAIPPWPEGLK